MGTGDWVAIGVATVFNLFLFTISMWGLWKTLSLLDDIEELRWNPDYDDVWDQLDEEGL